MPWICLQGLGEGEVVMMRLAAALAPAAAAFVMATAGTEKRWWQQPEDSSEMAGDIFRLFFSPSGAAWTIVGCLAHPRGAGPQVAPETSTVIWWRLCVGALLTDGSPEGGVGGPEDNCGVVAPGALLPYAPLFPSSSLA